MLRFSRPVYFPQRSIQFLAAMAACLLAAPLWAEDDEDEVITRTYAHIELRGSYPEGSAAPGLFGELHDTLTSGLKRFDKAAKDDDVTGVVLHINGPDLGWAKLNEFRKAIQEVRASGKTVTAWMESGIHRGLSARHRLRRIVMPESGMLMLLGVRAEVTFYKNLFDMIGVKAEMLRVGEFKSAGEPYMRTEMSPAFRKEMEAILDDYYRQIVRHDRRKSRKLDAEKVKSIIDVGPLTASARERARPDRPRRLRRRIENDSARRGREDGDQDRPATTARRNSTPISAGWTA